VTRELCAVCGERAGDRRCLALDRRLCSSCCGSHRGKIVRCPADCPYGRVAEERLRERRAKELERAWGVWYRELAAAGGESIWSHIELLGEAVATLLRRDPAVDSEIEGALRHLDQALSPVVLVSTAPPALGRALAEDGLVQLVRGGKLDGAKLRKAAQALAAWLAGYRSEADPHKFARGLLGLFPPPPEQPEGLIVRPPRTV